MLMPKKVKYRKSQKNPSYGKSYRGSELSFGRYGIKAVEASWLSSRQIEAARRAMTRYIKRGGKVWIRVFPDKPITKKASETPMGSGKGAPEYFVSDIRPGRVLFEMDGVPYEIAKEALRLASHKLPMKTKLITTEESEEDEG